MINGVLPARPLRERWPAGYRSPEPKSFATAGLRSR